MRGTASAVQRKPTSLMHRLALITGTDRDGEKTGTAYEPSIGGYFGIGLVGGGMAGAVVLVCFPMFGPVQWTPRRTEPPAIAALAPWMTPSPRASSPATEIAAVHREPQPDTFDLNIDRSARSSVPFGLQLVGSSDGRMEVLLRDIPESVSPSRGERRGPSTWALKAAELEGLQLALGDEAPDSFNVRIEVVAPAGVAAAPSVARVRLTGQPAVEQVATAPVAPVPVQPVIEMVKTRPSSVSPDSAAPVASGRPAPRKAKVARVAPPPAVATAEVERRPQAAPPTEGRHFPEGASALGATTHESDRQVWWKLPPPTWSPFLQAAGR